MKQPKYNPQEALERIKLMMEYDSSKTLDENKKTISEQYVAPTVAAGATGAALGAGAVAASTTTAGASVIVPVMSALGVGATAAGAIVGGAAAIAVLPLVYWLVTKDTGANKVKKMFEMCSSDSAKIAKLPRKLQDTDLRSISDDIEDAIINDSFGFQGGTDEEKLFGAFKKLESGTASDFCALVTIYNKNSDSGDLFDDLDSDIDAESEWKQIFRPIRNCVEDSLLSIKDDAPIKTDGGKTGWAKYPCVVSHPNAKKTADSSGGVVYLINGVYYYGNGRKMLANRTMGNYTCNDPEFKTERKGGVKTGGSFTDCPENMPIKYGCKNETIKTVQACLKDKHQMDLKDDGKFGPKTKQALIDIGQNGDQIDSGTIIAACKESSPNKPPNPDEIIQVDADDSIELTN
jgi:hypothetical protein